MSKLSYCCGVLCVIGLSGCTTLSSGRNARALRQDNEFNALKARVAEIENRVNDSEAARRHLYEENEAMLAGVRKENDDLRRELERMQGLIKAVSDARVKDREEVVEILSKRVSELLRKQPKEPAYQTGREHTVQPGETLSEIARAYNVTVRAIVGANKVLGSADTVIRPGQKLFIPE